MPYYLAQSPILNKDIFEISGEEGFHLVVTSRAKVGEKVVVQDLNQKRFLCEIVSVSRKSANLKTIQEITLPKPSSIKIQLCTPYLPENTLNIALTKTTELGVDEIIIFQSEYCSINLKDKLEQKLERWQKILQSSTQQCMRASSPILKTCLSFEELLKTTETNPNRFMFDLDNTVPWPEKLEENTACIIIGPEGGFSQQELLLAKNSQNMKILSLGSTILRSETASVASVAALMGKYSNLA